MTRPPRPHAALHRLAAKTGIQHGQLGVDLWAVLGYIAALEDDDAALRDHAGRVGEVEDGLAAQIAHMRRMLTDGPGDQLETVLAGEPVVPAVQLGHPPTPRPREAS